VPREWQEEFTAAVWVDGLLGLEAPLRFNAEAVDCYFAPGTPAPILGGVWAERGVTCLSTDVLPDADWLEGYRRGARPFDLGNGFRVDPGEPGADRPETPDRRLLRLPARRAFGTGSHESTRLAVGLLERAEVAGARVLDVGCGTGVLGFVSLVLGAREVVAFDNDPVAVFCAAENAELNGLRPWLLAASIDAIDPLEAFDIVVVNVLPGRILGQMEQLAQRVEAGGRLLYSGATEAEEGRVERALRFGGLEVVDRLSEGEWIGLAASREAG